MEKQYIPIELSLDKKPGNSIEELQDHKSWKEVKNEYNKIMVLADPGMGKSTLLKMEAWQTAKVAISRIITDNKTCDEIVFPIYLTFSDLTQNNGEVVDVIMEVIERDYPNLDISCLDILKNNLCHGQCVILIDALDEVSVKHLKQLSEKVNRFFGNYKCQLICTSRIVGYGNSFLQFGQELEIMPFGRDDIDRYIKLWAENASTINKNKVVFDEGLFNKLRHEYQLDQFCKNPLLLSLMCRLFLDKSSCPKRSVEIYSEALECVIDKWSRSRNPQTELWITAKKVMLEDLAYHFSKKGQEVFSDIELIRWMDKYFDDKETLKILRESSVLDILNEISIDDGIITKIDSFGKSYRFAYRTFQGILTASYLLRNINDDLEKGLSLVKKHLWDFSWHETIALLSGLMKDSHILVKSITDENDDVFNSLLILAGMCIAECENSRHPFYDEIIEKIYRLNKEFVFVNSPHVSSVVHSLGLADTIIIDLLNKDFNSQNEIQRLVACFTLGQIGNKKALDLIERGLKDDFQSIQKYSTEYLIKSGNMTPVKILTENFDDEGSDFKCSAIRAIRKTGSSEAFVLLRKALKDWDRNVRNAAIDSLIEIGDKKAYRLLTNTFDNKDSEVTLEILNSIIGIETVEASLLFNKAIKHGDVKVRRTAFEYLEEIDFIRDHKLILKALSDEDSFIRCSAVRHLSKIEVHRACKLLAKSLHDKDSHVRGTAVKTLGKIGTNESLEIMSDALNDEDESVRCLATGYIWKMNSLTALEKISGALHSSKTMVRRSAIESLENIVTKDNLEYFPEVLNDEDVVVRMKATDCLTKVGTTEAIELLSLALRDRDNLVRGAAARNLGEIGSDYSLELLIEALKDEDSFVRTMATRYIWKMENRKAFELLSNALCDQSESVRRDAVESLGKIKHSDAIVLLRKALHDKADSVRCYAVKSLARIGTNEVLELLNKALSDKTDFVRREAVIGIESIGTNDALKLLNKILGNRYRELRLLAAQYLTAVNNNNVIDPLISVLKKEKGAFFKNNLRDIAIKSLDIVGNLQVVNKLHENKLISTKNPDVYELARSLVIRNCREKDFKPVYPINDQGS